MKISVVLPPKKKIVKEPSITIIFFTERAVFTERARLPWQLVAGG